ncbi:hypothetical protein BO70DRAFT_354408 [Aspergillus heteromorphus CBS 117.55]|uniref:Uncharacterized protein n=1 Tax=Aspergillus heteromorphus CBS 117.55 TaxID=1448321 RepID=A0A317VM67_9EURO|nr:uncharacterized protein BO70DRAFT_354408 [Aspergillus heteromorphus CBS 117.55]PWY75473.1 hypothetical protein BO70DRAFT_354408 [Aspergillus heteromorphus CBS 117.55]
MTIHHHPSTHPNKERKPRHQATPFILSNPAKQPAIRPQPNQPSALPCPVTVHSSVPIQLDLKPNSLNPARRVDPSHPTPSYALCIIHILGIRTPLNIDVDPTNPMQSRPLAQTFLPFHPRVRSRSFAVASDVRVDRRIASHRHVLGGHCGPVLMMIDHRWVISFLGLGWVNGPVK